MNEYGTNRKNYCRIGGKEWENIQNGEDLTVQFDIDAREYNGRWYNDFRAYNVIRGQQIPQPSQPVLLPPISDLPFDAPTLDVEDPFRMADGDQLPF